MDNHKVKVIDSIMGSGKTSWAIQKMKKDENKRFLYVTPFLNEVRRVLHETKTKYFKEPKDSEYRTKSDDLKELILNNNNIASTHQLFKLMDSETIRLLRERDYTLILDEVLDVIEQLPLPKREIQAMFRSGVLFVTEEKEEKEKEGTTRGFLKVYPGKEPDLKKYNQYREMAKLDRLIYVNDTVLVWLLPIQIFEAFKEIYNLTYLFDGSLQKAYYDLFFIDYDYYSVMGTHNEGFSLVEHDSNIEVTTKQQIRNKIIIYEGFLNNIGNHKFAFSKRWYQNLKPKDVKRIRGNI